VDIAEFGTNLDSKPSLQVIKSLDLKTRLLCWRAGTLKELIMKENLHNQGIDTIQKGIFLR
jgi:hypothetical protein